MPIAISTDLSPQALNSRYKLLRTLLAGVLSLMVAIGIGRFAYTPALPIMQQTFGLTTAAAGALASINYLGYLAGAIFAAFVPAGRARERLLRTSLLLTAASTAAMAATTASPVWLALRFLSGLAGAGVFVLASSAVLEELSRLGGTKLSGWFYSGVGLGIALSGLVVMPLNAFILQGQAWWLDWLLLGFLATVLVVPCWMWLPAGKLAGATGETSGLGSQEATESKNDLSSDGVSLVMTLLCVAYFLEGGGYIVTGTFLPAIVEGLPGLEGAGVGLWVLVGVTAAPSTLVWTRVAARLGQPTALILAYAGQAAGIVLPAVSPAWWAAVGSAALFGGTIMGIVALTLPYAREVVGARKAGLAIGLLTAVYGVGQALGPLIAARLVDDAGGFEPALVAASVAVGLAGLLMAVVTLFDRTGSRKENLRGIEN